MLLEFRPTFRSGTPTNDYFNATCTIPVNQYFWLNSLHPTYPMHDVLAHQVALQLTAGPNVC
jgi:phospholipase/lecithinase/hemolysin